MRSVVLFFFFFFQSSQPAIPLIHYLTRIVVYWFLVPKLVRKSVLIYVHWDTQWQVVVHPFIYSSIHSFIHLPPYLDSGHNGHEYLFIFISPFLVCCWLIYFNFCLSEINLTLRRCVWFSKTAKVATTAVFLWLASASLQPNSFDGWMDGWMGGWVDGWVYGWIDR